MPETLEEITQGYNALAPEVRDTWALEQVQTIRNTVAKDLSVAEFQMGLAVAARYGLDPLLHEIWFAKAPARDGRAGRTMIMTGRDGFLKVARSRSDFRGIDCDVHRKNDTFRVTRHPDGQREVFHQYEGSETDRGEIMGAWCIATFDGKIPFYYYANLSEYLPKSENARKFSPWASQVSVMILKCAQSYALRIACGISGMVGEEESARAFEDAGAVATEQHDSLSTVMAEVPGDLRDRLYGVYGEAAELRPGHLTPAALQMHVRGQERGRVLEFIVRQEELNAATKAERRVVGERGEALERLADADVVEPDVPIDDVGLPEVVEEDDGRSLSAIVQDEVDSIDAAEEMATSLGDGHGEPPPATNDSASAPSRVESTPVARDTSPLRSRLDDLHRSRREVEENPGGYVETERTLAEIDAEIAQVQEELTGAETPGQESLL